MARREFGEGVGWQAGLLALLLPLAGTMGLLALPDVPLLLASALCLDAGLRLLRKVDRWAAMELALGLVIGALGMVPRWWKHRVAARRAHQGAAQPAADAGPSIPHGF